MLTDCEARKIDIILTKSISRFARNTVDLLETVLTSIPHKFAHAAGNYQTLILTLGFCGLRWGEAAAFRAKHVDTQTNRLKVRLSWVRSGRDHFEGDPKTWEIRDVPVPA